MRDRHRIIAISAGPGNKEHITDLAKRKAQECEVIIGSAEQLEAVGVAKDQEVYEEWGVENILKLLEQLKGRRVGVLLTGDAGIYSLTQKIADRFGKDALEEVVPGVSSIQVAFARIKETWVNVRVFSYRERPLEGLEELFAHERVAVLCDREHHAALILSELSKHGLFQSERGIYVCQNLTLEDESIVEITGDNDIEKLESKRWEIIILINEKNQR